MIVGVILAAGRAARMGKPKQLLLLDGRPLVWHVAATACRSELDQVMVVSGAYAAEVREALAGLPLEIVHNPSWEDGQSGSLAAAVLAAAPAAKAMVFMLADQPLVDEVLINRLVDAYRSSGAGIVAPYWQNRRGNPVLFDLGMWRQALLELNGDAGARSIIDKNMAAVHRVELEAGEAFLDVDTPADYEQVGRLWRSRKKENRPDVGNGG